MEQSYSGSDISMSPSQILERLQVLRQLQILQRGKLQKQRLQYQESENSSSITEIVSHFSNSTSYNTFRSLLQSSCDLSNEVTPRCNTSDISQKVKERDLIEGVSLLNLSQESEFLVNSPVSSTNQTSAPSRVADTSNGDSESPVISKPFQKKHISLDEMPILSPKKDFESLIVEKLQSEKNIVKVKSPKNGLTVPTHNKKPFLRRGEGMARFGLKKNELVIQNTKSLPWKRKSFDRAMQSPIKTLKQNKLDRNKLDVNNLATEPKSPLVVNKNIQLKGKCTILKENEDKETVNIKEVHHKSNEEQKSVPTYPINRNLPFLNSNQQLIEQPKGKHPLQATRGKTWAAVLTKEQNDFLRQLKQSDYYKNFGSPSKSVVSDTSCDENLSKARQERETAEQNMFELVENKVCNESFHLENSFFTKFFKRNQFECSGESTPLIMQKCLAKNPDLMHIVPPLQGGNSMCQSDVESCDYVDCSSDACSSVSSCCSCKTVETANDNSQNNYRNKKVLDKHTKGNNKKEVLKEKTNNSQNDTVTEDMVMKANMAEMNAKLVTTSELLKERLSELEDEIETFKKENSNLMKNREEVEVERQKFYEEKNAFEQKFNEEKILSEYYLAEEKEKLNKQKQMYERYVREMRGRLNKKDKDEVVNLKKEINDMKEEIRLKDAKSTSTIARLRNQLKIVEKEKKDLQDQVEKLKKENRRIQHSNDMTRRLTNIKYLAEINKKLSNMTSKETRSEVNIDPDMKYKAFEIERQSRSRKAQPVVKNTIRQRAKSVPNLKVTSRYAKYFSQRDVASSIEPNFTLNTDSRDAYNSHSDEEGRVDNDMDDSDSIIEKNTDTEDENHLEKLYLETFRTTSPKSTRLNTNKSSLSDNHDYSGNTDGFFIRKSNSNSLRSSKSPVQSTPPYLTYSDSSNRSKSPISILSHKSSAHISPLNSGEYSNISGSSSLNRSKSPGTSNPSSLRSATVIHKEQYREQLMVVSPEPSSSRTSLVKTNLNPTEIRKPDGSRELKFPNGNVKYISADGKYSKFVYYNGDIKENFYSEGRIKYFYSETKTYHTTHADGLEVIEFPDGQVEKRYKDGSSEIRLPNGSVRYFDPKNKHVREEWRFPDGAALTVAASGEQRILFSNGQVEVHAKDHKRREFPDGTVKLVYNDGTSETRYASGRVRIKDKHGSLIMDSAPG